MILVTVGMQLSFDRLIKSMDEIALSLDMPVIAQTGLGEFNPVNMEAHDRIAPDKFEALVKQSQLIVSHAGIGTVLTAQRFQKPILLVPRRADLGEHRNDHQLATASKLHGRPGVLVAMDEAELHERIIEGLAMENAPSARSENSQRLHQSIAQFIDTGRL